MKRWMLYLFCYNCRLAPAVLRQATYGTIKIGLYHSLKRLLFTDLKGKKMSNLVNTISFVMLICQLQWTPDNTFIDLTWLTWSKHIKYRILFLISVYKLKMCLKEILIKYSLFEITDYNMYCWVSLCLTEILLLKSTVVGLK